MCIIAFYGKEEVEVLDVYEVGGVKLASVKALQGKPFVGGDKWPVASEWGTVKACELSKSQGEELGPAHPGKPNLLTLALEHQGKRQWYSGESVWLWRPSKQKGAYLKESGGFVSLSLVGKRAYCVIYWLDPITWTWEVSKSVGSEYQNWVKKVQAER